MQELFLGDCLSVMPREIKDKSVDLILCDLPYGTTACKWDVVIPFDKLWLEYKRVVKTGGAICLFGAEPFSSFLRISNLEQFKYEWYWRKSQPSGISLSKTQPMRVIENILVFCDTKTKTFNKQLIPTSIKDRKMTDGKKNGSGNNGGQHANYGKVENIMKTMVNPVNCLDFKSVANAGGHKLHPTQKPIELLEYLIKTYTNSGDLVLDNCAGSGSTLVAARRLNRNFIGIEKDETYFNISQERLNSELL